MKSVSELTDFYYEILSPTLEKLEEDRKRVRYKIILFGFIYAFVATILFFIFEDTELGKVNLLGIIFLLYWFVCTISYQTIIEDYTSDFKNKIIEPLIKALDNKLNYTPDNHISQRQFLESNIFTTNPDRFSGNDFVRGEVDEVKIEFSDIHAEKEYKDSKGRTHWSTIFQGLFIVAEFNKHFHGKTVVLPDTAQSSFGDLIGGWLQSKNISRDELVKMDNIEFEDEFVVYSDDQIEARYILTPSFMEKLLAFKKKTKHPIYISFIGESIHLAIAYNKDLFEPAIFSSLLDLKVAMQYVQTLHLAIGIINELKLNEKLWSKQ